MKKTIKKVAVIGSGIMGSGIACHFANIGIEVLLLDIVPRELTEAETKKGLTLESKIVRNRIVNEHLANALKSKPSPIYHQKFASRITTGNTTDDLEEALAALSLIKLNSTLDTDDAKKTFWINIYNAFFQVLTTRDKKQTRYFQGKNNCHCRKKNHFRCSAIKRL